MCYIVQILIRDISDNIFLNMSMYNNIILFRYFVLLWRLATMCQILFLYNAFFAI